MLLNALVALVGLLLATESVLGCTGGYKFRSTVHWWTRDQVDNIAATVLNCGGGIYSTIIWKAQCYTDNGEGHLPVVKCRAWDASYLLTPKNGCACLDKDIQYEDKSDNPYIIYLSGPCLSEKHKC